MIILIALMLLVPTLAEAQTTDPINACVNSRNGKVRIAGSPAQCRNSEGAISWNREGPPGAATGAPLRFQLVGFTAQTFQGDQGVLGFTLACQVEFAGSRMCTSEEVMETSTLPPSLSGPAWVRPIFNPGAGATSNITEASGLSNQPSQLSCSGWSSTLVRGLVVDQKGSFSPQLGVCAEFLSVACCAPVP